MKFGHIKTYLLKAKGKIYFILKNPIHMKVKNMSKKAVSVKVEKVIIPTYPAKASEPNPMFFDKRAVQGAKGNIYPSPFTNRISSEKVDRSYTAVVLENEYIHVVLLPELGGRIFTALDKTNQYDFFYRHTVIKPALIGLCGAWISGGLEFNWPQHHRPSTFMPTDYTIEEQADGSKTVWMGEHDPLHRTKGMVGVCLHPGTTIVETKVRLYNRTPMPQSFLWWANAAVHIHEKYQVIFPPDVYYAYSHYKTNVASYPIAKGIYCSIDYGEKTDISWYANSPFPTSFFAGDSKYDFFGGYDHVRQAGVVHVADHHISPGKKFFTWANGPFGHKWQRNLMDDEGEYLELMAGVYTDNQPDFTWIAPYESKVFSQFWYPVQAIGPMKNANTKAAVNLEVHHGIARLGVYPTTVYHQVRVILAAHHKTLSDEKVDLCPGKAYVKEVSLPGGTAETDLQLQVCSSDGMELIRFIPEKTWTGTIPGPITPLEDPGKVESIETLYLMGLHIEQYRHPVMSAEPYWKEALLRDPGDTRCNVAMGKVHLRRGMFGKAEEYLRTAIRRLMTYNFNPVDSEAHYCLGQALVNQGRQDEAYEAFGKAIWNYAWQSASYYALTQIDSLRRDYARAREHVEQALQTNTQHLQARNLKTAIFRTLKNYQDAQALAAETSGLDKLDFWSRYELVLIARAQGLEANAQKFLAEFKQLLRNDAQNYLDLAFDYADAGMWDEASSVLNETAAMGKPYPMAAYAQGYFARQQGNKRLAMQWYAKGAHAAPDYCFPMRWQEMLVLEDVIVANPQDGRAHYYLGNLLYDKHRYHEAVPHWQEAAKLEPGFAIPWRNLALASYNMDHNADAAYNYFEKAFAANPQDARILFEFDQLAKRKGCRPEERLARLENNLMLVEQREDLCVELAALYNCLGQPEKALVIVRKSTFHPWEGGEGIVTGQYMDAHWLLGRQELEKGHASAALKLFETGLDFPENLGDIPSDQATAPLQYYIGLTHEALDHAEQSHKIFYDLYNMKMMGVSPQDCLPMNYYKSMALFKLGKAAEAREKLEALLDQSKKLAETEPKFYQFLPNPVFEDEMKKINQIRYRYVAGLAHLGLGQRHEARQAFSDVLKHDPSHLGANEEIKRIKV